MQGSGGQIESWSPRAEIVLATWDHNLQFLSNRHRSKLTFHTLACSSPQPRCGYWNYRIRFQFPFYPRCCVINVQPNSVVVPPRESSSASGRNKEREGNQSPENHSVRKNLPHGASFRRFKIATNLLRHSPHVALVVSRLKATTPENRTRNSYSQKQTSPAVATYPVVGFRHS